MAGDQQLDVVAPRQLVNDPFTNLPVWPRLCEAPHAFEVRHPRGPRAPGNSARRSADARSITFAPQPRARPLGDQPPEPTAQIDQLGVNG
jgi:hypothetical protein